MNAEPARECPVCHRLIPARDFLEWQDGTLVCFDCHAKLLAADLEAWEERQRTRQK